VAEEKIVVEDLIIEGILAGVFRTCDAVELTPFGEWLIGPFRPILDKEGYVEAMIDKIIPAGSTKSVKDTVFLQRFVKMAVGTDEQALLSVLNKKPYQQHVVEALGAASVQLTVFLCLNGVYCREVATKKGLLKASNGKLSRLKN